MAYKLNRDKIEEIIKKYLDEYEELACDGRDNESERLRLTFLCTDDIMDSAACGEPCRTECDCVPASDGCMFNHDHAADPSACVINE